MMNPNGVRKYLENVAYMDLRSLGVFRILLGIVILFDLSASIQDVHIFYGVDAILPLEKVRNSWYSIHAWVLSNSWIYGLFIVQMIAAVSFTLGFRTRWSALLLFLLYTSLHWRFTPILNASDKLLRLLLLMSVFLPVGYQFSLDKKMSKRVVQPDNKYFSLWSVAYLIQILFIYATAGYSKNNGTWNKGFGIHYSLHLTTYAKWTAEYMLALPPVMIVFNYLTLAAERALVFVLLVNQNIRFNRVLTALIMAGFHFGLFLFLELGKFPWLGILLWVPLVPSEVWDKYCPSSPKLSLQCAPKWSNYLAMLFILLTVYANLKAYKVIPNFKPLSTIQSRLYFKQGWGVFKGPPKSDGWLVSDAVLEDGSHVDIYSNRDTVVWSKPKRYSASFKNQNHREYFRNIRRSAYRGDLKEYVRWQVHQWNIAHKGSEQIDSVSFYYMKEPILRSGGYGPVEKEHLYTLKCRGD